MTVAARENVTDQVASGDSLKAKFATVPIFYRVLGANVLIVLVGAFLGTWVTIKTVEHAPRGEVIMLATIFAAAGFLLSLAANVVVLRTVLRPLDDLRRTATAVRAGDTSARARLEGITDPALLQLATTLNGTLDELDHDRQQLRSLTTQVIHAQEEERRRVARELHDDTAQVLFAQLLRITPLKDLPDPAVQSAATFLEQTTVEALESVRRLALELRPPALDDLGLKDALGDLAQRFSDTLRLPITYKYQGGRGRLPANVELVLYRIAQEAMTNIAKHASATNVEIDVERSRNMVTLSVRDNGRGFETGRDARQRTPEFGLGLFGMEERAALVGGSFSVESAPGRGTRITTVIPIDEPLPQKPEDAP